MRKEITAKEAEGRTVEHIAFHSLSAQCVITFTDDTFTTLGVNTGYEAGDESIEGQELSIFGYGDSQLVSLGILTEDELQATKQEKTDLHAKQAESFERSTYERLKLKFGKGSDS